MQLQLFGTLLFWEHYNTSIATVLRIFLVTKRLPLEAIFLPP